MSYSARLTELAAKYKQFFADETPGQILGMICPYTFPMDYAAYGIPDRPLSSWDFTKPREFADHAARQLRAFLKETDGLDNDYFPAIFPNLGCGVHSAFYSGAEVTMGIDTSWVHPVIRDWSDMEKLTLSRENFWYQVLREILLRLREGNDGDFALSTLCNNGPGDMANALRGNDLFYDLYDEPDMAGRLFDLSADATIWLERELKQVTGYLCGGTVAANVWFPGDAPYLSEDFSDLCSAELFCRFGKPRTQKILDTFGGGYIHHHAKGWHVHGEIASLDKVRLLEISWDPNCPRPVDRLDELMEYHTRLPLMIRCTAEDVYRYIDQMKRGRVVLMLNVDTVEEGREVMRFIRKHSIL